MADNGIAKSLAWLQAMAQQRQRFGSSTLEPYNAGIGRNDSGAWAGAWTRPPASVDVPYTPVIVQGPLWFPITPGMPVDFTGSVDVPFASMDGWVGRRDMANPDSPPDFIADPSTVYADGGTNWGSYFIVGEVEGETQFVARIGANTYWSATVSDPPAGSWSFQLVTYADQIDADADVNRILVGHPWLETERPGDVRDYLLSAYVEQPPQFTDVILQASAGADDNVITGTLAPFSAIGGRTYQVLATNETDVEYAWALEPVSGAGAFTIARLFNQEFGGKIKLRLVEQLDGCSVRVVGQVWAEENAADADAYQDLRIEYRAITGAIPTFPNSVQPAQLDGSWSVTLAAPSIGRVSLVDVNTKRIYGEYTMPSGLMRSFIVPPQAAGQNTSQVYYDGFMDTCFLYDQAVALIALLALGEREMAAKLVESLLLVQNPDGSFPFANNQFALDHNDGFIRNGAIAWVCYALLLADQEEYRDWFSTRTTTAAEHALAFIMSYTNTLGTINGGKGQYVDGVLDPDFMIPWWSMEHNIDTWWCLDLADALYGSRAVDYRGAADAMKEAMLTPGMGWDETNGIFWQGGTVVGGVNTPDGMHALDTHTWGAALLEHWNLSAEARSSIERAYELYYLTDEPTGLPGFTTFVPQDGYPPETVEAVWYEGSFGAVAAMRTIDPMRAQELAQLLVPGQRPDGSYLYALQEDTINDIHPWPCLIAPAWNIVAMAGGWPAQRAIWTRSSPMPEFENILFLTPSLSDRASLTPSSEVTSLPAVFVQSAEPTKVWRTTGCAAEYLILDFGTGGAVIDAAAIVAHNATSAGMVQLRLAATIPALAGGPAVDSGIVSLWPASGKHTDPDWPHELSLVRVVNSTAYRYARLDFADAANPAGYLEFGRIAVGRGWQPGCNIDLDPSIGYVPIDVQEPNSYGQTFTDPRPHAQRQFDLSFSSANEADVFEYAMELSRLRGRAGDLIVAIDPAATARFHKWSMQALFTGRATYKAQPFWDGTHQVWGFSASLIEKL